MDLVKMLQTFASKDETRYHLGGVYFDSTHAVSTDGHRMLIVPREMLIHQFSIYQGKIFNFKIQEVIDGKFPEWKSIKPSYDEGLALIIPSLFAGAKGRHAVKVWYKSGSWYLQKKDGAACFDARLLAPLAGIEGELFVKDELKPMLFKFNNGCEAVIMPMRG